MIQGLGYYTAHLLAQWAHYFHGIGQVELIWLFVGLLGQAMFMMRFVVQWLHSERHAKSVIPVSFWYLSLAGGLIVLAYGIHKTEPVIIIGQIPGTFVYLRNLMLIHREKQTHAQTP